MVDWPSSERETGFGALDMVKAKRFRSSKARASPSKNQIDRLRERE